MFHSPDRLSKYFDVQVRCFSKFICVEPFWKASSDQKILIKSLGLNRAKGNLPFEAENLILKGFGQKFGDLDLIFVEVYKLIRNILAKSAEI